MVLLPRLVLALPSEHEHLALLPRRLLHGLHLIVILQQHLTLHTVAGWLASNHLVDRRQILRQRTNKELI